MLSADCDAFGLTVIRWGCSSLYSESQRLYYVKVVNSWCWHRGRRVYICTGWRSSREGRRGWEIVEEVR
jgi:hypothetical protein